MKIQDRVNKVYLCNHPIVRKLIKCRPVNFNKGMMYRKLFFVSKQEKTMTSLFDLGQKR